VEILYRPSCNHALNVYTQDQQCGRQFCTSMQCDECYEGHILEAHLFESVPEDAWRDMRGLYISTVLLRAQRGKELCYGYTTPLRTLGSGEGK